MTEPTHIAAFAGSLHKSDFQLLRWPLLLPCSSPSGSHNFSLGAKKMTVNLETVTGLKEKIEFYGRCICYVLTVVTSCNYESLNLK